MAGGPFSWMWRDPAENIDRLRDLRVRMEKAEKELKERERIRNRRKIRKLVKLAMARQLKGQSSGR